MIKATCLFIVLTFTLGMVHVRSDAASGQRLPMFHLEVQKTEQSDRALEFVLRIISESGEMIVLEQQEALRLQASLIQVHTNKPRESKITLAVTKNGAKGHDVVSMETSAARRGGQNYSFGLNKSEYDVDLPTGQGLAKSVSVTATNGMYKEQQVLEIGTLLNKALRLTIGKRDAQEVGGGREKK
jgi:hypothetical protein